MLLDFLFWITTQSLNLLNLVPLDYDLAPLPEWVYTNIAQVFGTMKLLLELPIIRVIAGWFWQFYWIWLLIWGWNFWLKIASVIPGLHGLIHLQHSQSEQQFSESPTRIKYVNFTKRKI